MTPVVVATRSPDKLREITEMLAGVPGIHLLDLDAAGVPELPEEAEVEIYDTFEGNALAKAKYYSRRSRSLALADDSGLCVDALDGNPGVLSKRFSGRTDLGGAELDRANNALLLERLDRIPDERRTGHYVCVVALVDPATGREAVVRATCDGIILRAPRGDGGFGYDPLFYLPSEHATFGELPRERKNQISHRAGAVRGAAEILADPTHPAWRAVDAPPDRAA